MSGFYLCRDDERAKTRLAAARAMFARHGFATPETIDFPGWRGFHVPYLDGGPDTLLRDGDDCAAVAGTFLCHGRTGAGGLRAALADPAAALPPWSRVLGHFGIVLRKRERTFVATDFFGAFQVFHDTECSVVTSSFLAAASSVERLTWHPQALYEYAFGVAPIGNDTVFAEICRLGPDVQLELGETVVRHPLAKPLTAPATPARPAALRDAIVAQLRLNTRPYAAAFGDKVQCPLSGGLDSRLALSLLRDAGVAPHVYVYGELGEQDVDIAVAVGAAEGFAVEVFDKAGWRTLTPGEFARQVEDNFYATGGLVTDGSLFDNGGNTVARRARATGGQLAVSGGCGEILRNFFYLPNRRLTARQLVETFFARYHRPDTTGEFDPGQFIDTLEAKALAALDLPKGTRGRLRREQIEELYPRMRCRAFFGREISLVSRHGAYLMPFLEPSVVALALRIPLAAKNNGRFERKVITLLDPGLAAQMSSYGDRVDETPSRRQRFAEWATRARPVWLRRLSYTIQRRLGRRIPDDHGAIIDDDYLGRAIDLNFPHMSRFFHVGPNAPMRHGDIGLYRRVATLEYLGQVYADRLRH